MKRMLIGLLVGLALVAVGRRLRTPADDLVAAAAGAYGRGDFARSAELYRSAATAGRDTPAVAHNHAAALYRQARYGDAEERYEHSGSDARTAYNRGNCLLGQGCPDGESTKPDFLTRAAEQYRASLGREGQAANAGSLFEDARHNLELAKLLLAQASENEHAPDDPHHDHGEALAQRDPTDPAAGTPPEEDECPS